MSTKSPSGTGSGFVTTTHHYNASGQLERVSSNAPNVPDQLTFYHPLGHAVKSGQDLDGDGQLTLGQDRMTESDQSFVKENSTWWAQSTTTTQVGPNSPPLVETTRSRLSFNNPALLSESRTTGPHGGTTIATTEVELDAGGQPQSRVTSTVNLPGTAIDAVTVTIDGYRTSATSHLSAVAETWVYAEPAEGGFLTIHTNRLGGVTRTTLNRLGQTTEVRDPVNRRVLYTYETDPTKPAIGMLTATTNGENETITLEYDLLGRKTYQGGATYPVVWQYDVLDRMTRMTTYRDEKAAGTDTVWSYHPHSGLLDGKRYDANGSNKGPNYEYDSAGRLVRLSRSRNIPETNTPVQVEYTYNTSGVLASTEYNDGTPDVYFQGHDLFGRPASVTDSWGTVNYSYDQNQGALASETYAADHAVLPGLSRTTDYGQNPGSGSFLQPFMKSVLQGQQQLTWEYFQYDNVGRRNVYYHQPSTDPSFSLYHAQSLYIAQFYEGSAIPESQQIEDWNSYGSFFTKANLDSSYRLNSRRTTDTLSGAVLTSVGYAHDRAGRRTHATREDGTTWRYDYNERGEVTNAAKLLPDENALAGQQFAYAYDDIGNRTTASYGGGTGTNAGAQRQISYSANALNQYTSINHPQTADILGLNDPDAEAVTVTGQLADADQQGDRFRVEVQASQPGGEWFDVKLSSGTSSPVSQGARWIPAAQTQPEYDDDGNLLNDGRWKYKWDAENRLIGLEPTPAALAGGHPNLKLNFAYDHLSRRIQKRVLDGANNDAVLSDRRFLYDGWNLVAEFEATPQNDLDPVALHAWANDLSNTSQGAGGVGGLYASHVKRANGTWDNYFPSYDGNGNIIAWIDDQGTVAQRRDYDAFGNELTQDGTLPGGVELSFGFSTKYQDSETGLLYYGYRYYDPLTGRWPSRDPIGERGGINLYGMVGNDVVGGVDYWGLFRLRNFEWTDAARKARDTGLEEFKISHTVVSDGVKRNSRIVDKSYFRYKQKYNPKCCEIQTWKGRFLEYETLWYERVEYVNAEEFLQWHSKKMGILNDIKEWDGMSELLTLMGFVVPPTSIPAGLGAIGLEMREDRKKEKMKEHNKLKPKARIVRQNEREVTQRDLLEYGVFVSSRTIKGICPKYIEVKPEFE